jgi:DNA-binding NarL/FixJ family response regulator
MLHKLLAGKKTKYQKFKIFIVEPNQEHSSKLAQLIQEERPYHDLYQAETFEDVFTAIYEELPIDIVIFDIETTDEPVDISLVQAILPEVRLINWSNCRHPEVIEFLYSLGVKYFCIKNSNPKTIIEAIDYSNNNQNILYLDKQLGNCLSLLKN